MPHAGTQVFPGSEVNMVVSRGIQPSVMPDVLGIPQSEAKLTITGAGLVLGGRTRLYSETILVGNVISQNPAADTELAPETAVSIVVSLGPLPTEEEPVDTDTAQQQLAEAFDQADINSDGHLTFEEAVAAIPGLTQSVFDQLDINGDGQLTHDELDMETGCGCIGCQGVDVSDARVWMYRMPGCGCIGCQGVKSIPLCDGFAVLFGLLGLAAMAKVRMF